MSKSPSHTGSGYNLNALDMSTVNKFTIYCMIIKSLNEAVVLLLQEDRQADKIYFISMNSSFSFSFFFFFFLVATRSINL